MTALQYEPAYKDLGKNLDYSNPDLKVKYFSAQRVRLLERAWYEEYF
jgi:hypothetical protein